MIDKDDFNAATNIMIPIENLEGSRNMIDIQNEGKMANMEKELEIWREELRQVRDLDKLSATTFPTFKTPIYYAKANLPSPHVPPIYATRAPTFTVPTVVNVPYEVNQYAEMEKDTQMKEDASIMPFKMGDFIEEGVKSGMIQSIVALQAAIRDIQAELAYQNAPRPYFLVHAPIHQNRPVYAPRPYPNFEARNTQTYTPIAESYAQLFEKLRTVGVLQPVEEKLPDPIPHNFDGNKRCAYHLGIQGHDTEDCYGLKNQIDSLIRRGVIKCTSAPPNVNNNPLPNHENWEVNMVTLDEEYGGPNCPDIDEPDDMASSAQSIITVQLREPLTVQTYLPREARI
ncbi:hypothetical protein H5410_056773 [Solanum commersonii]|uniref:Gag-pro-like protein n=1 Tax=Solanum commersonii TaxID=4109 RepID=A0A9J5WN72_SOLCO|nr:hypothetical protein H5410_056773 [Solanum commersonii]